MIDKDMGIMVFATLGKRNLAGFTFSMLQRLDQVIGVSLKQIQAYASYSTYGQVKSDNNKGKGGISLAQSLASLLNESPKSEEKKPKTGMELKRLIETRIKKRVKEQVISGRFKDLMSKVIANPTTLRDAYNCIRLNSNIDLESKSDDLSFESMAEELSSGGFIVKENTFSISTRGERKETLVFPSLKLKVVQEAIRIVLEVVYRPHFSKYSHGCRSGRGHYSALRYICKDIHNPTWWFTMHAKKKFDTSILNKLISAMEENIEDPNLYSILRSMSEAQVLNLEFGGFPKGQGLPQEGVLSPILMNIYLDCLDKELYAMSMRYEALSSDVNGIKEKQESKLRNWFRRQLKEGNSKEEDKSSSLRLYVCRFMDEIFVAVSGSKEIALDFKSGVQKYIQNSLYLDVDGTDVLPFDSLHGVRYLGTIVHTKVNESPAVRAVHKLKEKVELFASQKQEIWDSMSVRIGKKCLGHGLKKVKESEIKHLADTNSLLSNISNFRKVGMETDHWFKALLKIWMQDVNAKAENSDEILGKYVAEPSLPQELKDAYYNFQKCVEEYVSSETSSMLALSLNSSSNTKCTTTTEILAPIDTMKKKLLIYGLVSHEGYPRPTSALILQDDSHIIDWFSGLVRRWLIWYSDCSNLDEVKLMINHDVRMSCIRTLAAKHRIHETKITKKFDSELSMIPSTIETELEMVNEVSDSQGFYDDEALNYGVGQSGLCILSLARIVSASRSCNCFVTGCLAAAPNVYTLHVMEKQKFPSWKTGFAAAIHPCLNGRRIGLCKKHIKDLYMGHISLQSIEFGAWK